MNMAHVGKAWRAGGSSLYRSINPLHSRVTVFFFSNLTSSASHPVPATLCANAFFHWSDTLATLLIRRDEASCEFPVDYLDQILRTRGGLLRANRTISGKNPLHSHMLGREIRRPARSAGRTRGSPKREWFVQKKGSTARVSKVPKGAQGPGSFMKGVQKARRAAERT